MTLVLGYSYVMGTSLIESDEAPSPLGPALWSNHGPSGS